MAWTTPKTWAANAVLTAAELNAHVRDNLDYLYDRPSVRAELDTATPQSIATGTLTAVDFDLADVWDTDAIHSPTTNPSRLTIPTGLGGRWHFAGVIVWASDATSYRAVKLRKNGTTEYDAGLIAPASGITTRQVFLGDLTLAAGDYVEVMVQQATGAGLNVTAAHVVATWQGAT